MRRIIALGFIILSITGLAFAENGQPIDRPTAYSTKISSYKIIVVTPLDSKRSVLIGIQKEGQKKPDSYLAEGVLALAISKFTKMAVKVDNDKKVKKYAKDMVQAKALAVKVDSGKKLE
ncbi:MAG: hypothetical protein E3J54_04530 [Actinobacteria bacterium]|nr:MAG: hypothetical protein E3J54_04530 [Actinomycetota bacterium]